MHSWFCYSVFYYLQCSSSLSNRIKQSVKNFFGQNLFELMYNHKPKSNVPLWRKKNTYHLTVRGEGGVSPYGQPDRKISVFFWRLPFLLSGASIGLKAMVQGSGTYLQTGSPVLPFRCLDFLLDGGLGSHGLSTRRAWMARSRALEEPQLLVEQQRKQTLSNLSFKKQSSFEYCRRRMILRLRPEKMHFRY